VPSSGLGISHWFLTCETTRSRKAEVVDESLASVGGWRRGLGLFMLATALSVSEALPLVVVPFVALSMTMGTRKFGTTLVGAIGVVWVFGGLIRGDLWYLERGWAILLAGWFVALTLYRPSSRFLGRALWATLGTFIVSGVVIGSRFEGWSRLDWLVRQSLMNGVDAALEGVRLLMGDEGPSEALVTAVMRTAEQQGELFPALLGLSSLAALGTAWWLYVRLAWGSDRGIGPLREFRFNDHLVWLFIAGLTVLVLGLSESWARVGTNTVVFMGALYALRGAAVVAFLSGGLSFVSGLFLAIAMLFVSPLVIGGALIIGLGDTWLDVRTHAEKAAGSQD
jgi:predicted membrane protein DUF2232